METKDRSQIVLPVKMVPTIELTGGAGVMKTTNAHDSSILVTLEGGEDILVNTCSSGYGLISIQEIIDPLELELDILEVVYKSNIARFDISYKLNSSFLLGKEPFNYLIKIIHSYDGSTAFKAFLGCVDSEGVEYFGFPGLFMDITHTKGGIESLVESIKELILEGVPQVESYMKEIKTSKFSAKKLSELMGVEVSELPEWVDESLKTVFDYYKILMSNLLLSTGLGKFSQAKVVTLRAISLTNVKTTK